MAIIGIFQDSKGRGECRSCHARITWAETLKGKRMPFDGELVIVRMEGNPIDGRVVEYLDTDITPSHFATCPDAQKWRRR